MIDAAAAEFLKAVEGQRIIALYGRMGAGKTTFVSALCRVLGVEDQVGSPTFTIVNEYRSREGLPIYHFDFYRIEKPGEALDIGFEEYVYDSDGLCLMEWPENVEEILPPETLKVNISIEADGTRILEF